MITTKHSVAAFYYGGFSNRPKTDEKGKINHIDEHSLLRKPQPRYPAHLIHKYTLPDVRGNRLIFDGKYTTITGWEDNDISVMERYLELAGYCGINTLFFNVYGGINAEGKFEILMEKPLQIFLKLIGRKEFSHFRFAPFICSTIPRRELPIKVPVPFNRDIYRYVYANNESSSALIDYLFSQYYSFYPNNFFTIDDRPVIMFFDFPRLGIKNKNSLDINIVSEVIRSSKKNIYSKYRVVPYYVAVEDNLDDIPITMRMGIDAISQYTNLTYYAKANIWPIQKYQTLIKLRIEEWKRIDSIIGNPRLFIPAILSGFDSSPRVAYWGQGKKIEDKVYDNQNWYPLIPHVPWTAKTPKLFKNYLLEGIRRKNKFQVPFLNLGPLNEMTEQCSLIPFYDEESNNMDTTIADIIREIINKEFS